ncbi:MAG: hypothetical protein WAM70_02665 [Pyrinomonadaceae bacterium]
MVLDEVDNSDRIGAQAVMAAVLCDFCAFDVMKQVPFRTASD